MRKKLVQFFQNGYFKEQKWFFTNDELDCEIVKKAKEYGKANGYDSMNVLNGDAYEL